jgi:hypothetical protein
MVIQERNTANMAEVFRVAQDKRQTDVSFDILRRVGLARLGSSSLTW